MSFSRKFFWWLPSVIWMGVIFSFSATPSLHASPIGWQDFIIRKTAHIGEYFILAGLFYAALRRTSSLSSTAIITLVFVATVLFAASDEYHQTFVFDRTGRIRDVLIDGGGVLAFLLSLRILPLPSDWN